MSLALITLGKLHNISYWLNSEMIVNKVITAVCSNCRPNHDGISVGCFHLLAVYMLCSALILVFVFGLEQCFRRIVHYLFKIIFRNGVASGGIVSACARFFSFHQFSLFISLFCLRFFVIFWVLSQGRVLSTKFSSISVAFLCFSQGTKLNLWLYRIRRRVKWALVAYEESG